MLGLSVYAQKLECQSVSKGPDYLVITLADGSQRIDKGITDFSGYVLFDEKGQMMELEVD